MLPFFFSLNLVHLLFVLTGLCAVALPPKRHDSYAVSEDPPIGIPGQPEIPGVKSRAPGQTEGRRDVT